MATRVEYTSPHNIKFTFDAETMKTAFIWLATVQSVFDEECCGMCQSRSIKCGIRKVQNSTYFEFRCTKCNATLSVHQNEDQKGIYISWKDRKEHLATNGWYRYAGNSDNGQQSQAPAAPAPQRQAAPPPPPSRAPVSEVDTPF